jgi:hypothetical protein
MFDLWKEPLTEEEREKLLDKAAHEITKRKLEMPATLFLEMHKPLAYVGMHATLAFSPFLVPFLGFDLVNDFSRLFSDKENVELLMQRLEEHRKNPGFDEEARC